MKAICIKTLFNNNRTKFTIVNEGEIVDYNVEHDAFIVGDLVIKNPAFFAHFKIIDGGHKMRYSDFEYILCNYVFTTAVLFPEEYSGMRHLIIQTWDHAILITVNKEETAIRVSFENGQEIYSSYEEALDGIRNHKYDVKK